MTTLTKIIKYGMFDTAGVVGQNPYREKAKFDSIQNWKYADKLNKLQTFKYSVPNDEYHRANAVVERKLYIPFISPFRGLITERASNDSSITLVAKEFATHLERRIFTNDDQKKVTYTDENWMDRLWKHRQKFIFHSDHVYRDTVNMPISINLGANLSFANHALSNGDDFVVTRDDGITVIPHEIENYNNVTGELIIWLKVPKMSDTSDVEVYVYYDNGAASNQEDIINVWKNVYSTANNDGTIPFSYAMVQHLDANSVDSTENNNDGTDTTISYTQGDIIGNAAGFDAVDSKIDVGSGSTIDNIFVGGGWITAWIDPNSDGEGSIGIILDKGTNFVNGWILQLLDESGGFVRVRFAHAFTGTDAIWDTVVDIPINTKTRIDVFYDKDSTTNDPTIYINGSPRTIVNGLLTQTSTGTSVAEDDSAESLIMGNNPAQSRTFDGEIDEVRVMKSPPNDLDNLILTEFHFQDHPELHISRLPHEEFKKGADEIAQDVIDSANTDMPNIDTTEITGLISLWRLNGTPNDDKGSRNGTWTGTPTYVDGAYRNDKAASFIFSSYIKTGVSAHDHDTPFSFSFFWQGTDATLSPRLISNEDSNADGILVYFRTPGTPSLFMRDVFAGSEFIEKQLNTRIDDGRLYFMTVTYDGLDLNTGIKWYVNGIEDINTSAFASGGFGTNSMITTELLTLGAAPDGTRSLIGLLDDVRDYNVALTPVQVLKLFKQSQSGIDTIKQDIQWKLGDGTVTEIPDLISLWKLDGNVLDSKGDNDGIITGTNITFVDGKYGKALDFNGIDTKVEINNSSLHNIFTGGGTVSAIFNPKSDGEGDAGRIVSTGASSNGWILRTNQQSGDFVKIQFVMNFSTTDGNWETLADIPINEITHVALKYDDGDVTNNPVLYINGIPRTVGNGLLTETATPVGTRNSDATNPFWIGNNSPINATFDGWIDDVRVYGALKTNAEIKALFEATSSGVDIVRDDDIPSDIVQLSFKFKNHYECLNEISLLLGKDLFFDNDQHLVFIGTKGKTLEGILDIVITSNPKITTEDFANEINMLGSQDSVGVQKETNVSESTVLRFNYEKVIADNTLETEDHLSSIGNQMLDEFKKLTPQIKGQIPIHQFTKLNLKTGDIVKIVQPKKKLNGLFRVMDIKADSQKAKLSLESTDTGIFRVRSNSFSDIIEGMLKRINDGSII